MRVRPVRLRQRLQRTGLWLRGGHRFPIGDARSVRSVCLHTRAVPCGLRLRRRRVLLTELEPLRVRRRLRMPHGPRRVRQRYRLHSRGVFGRGRRSLRLQGRSRVLDLLAGKRLPRRRRPLTPGRCEGRGGSLPQQGVRRGQKQTARHRRLSSSGLIAPYESGRDPLPRPRAFVSCRSRVLSSRRKHVRRQAALNHLWPSRCRVH